MAKNSINFPYFTLLISHHIKNILIAERPPNTGDFMENSQKAIHNSESRITEKVWDSVLMISDI